jgi:hypothetical protein
MPHKVQIAFQSKIKKNHSIGSHRKSPGTKFPGPFRHLFPGQSEGPVVKKYKIIAAALHLIKEKGLGIVMHIQAYL